MYNKLEITQAVFAKTQQMSMFWHFFSMFLYQRTVNNKQGTVKNEA
jgi:hypothetical protein